MKSSYLCCYLSELEQSRHQESHLRNKLKEKAAARDDIKDKERNAAKLKALLS
uniref:Transposase n=1 Tax=Heterorhabditis bacteriophora TaxID=37862 RepID=A0A1I7WYV5_HETBA